MPLLFCFFFFFLLRKYCSFFWLPSYFLLTFDAYVFLLAQSSIHSFFSVSAPCRVSVSFFVVCSSMKLHWFRNFIILHKIMRLCCSLACAPALSCVCLISSSWNTVSSAIIYIRYNELQSNVHQDFSSSAPSFFSSSLITFFCFFLSFISFYFRSPFTTVLSSVLLLLLFLNTHSCALLSRYTKHQFILIWFCALDERTKAKTKIKAKQSAPSKRVELNEWNGNKSVSTVMSVIYSVTN